MVLFLYKTVPKEGHWRKKAAAAARFYFGVLPFSHWKWSYFENLIKFKKNGHTICDPYQILKKMFSLRHHGVKSFWTKVGDFPPMPLLLGLKQSAVLDKWYEEEKCTVYHNPLQYCCIRYFILNIFGRSGNLANSTLRTEFTYIHTSIPSVCIVHITLWESVAKIWLKNNSNIFIPKKNSTTKKWE